jgi:glycosyltransferase involved in cell wall biosynthesis
MPLFAQMLKSSFEAKGCDVEMWAPQPRVIKWVPQGRFSKWGGYADQYLLFPIWVRKALRRTSADTLFVFCDQALGPWVPLVAHRPHVVHVHDLLALRSALGDIPENPTSITGRIYQRYIRNGFRHARHFISVSRKSRDDLHRWGDVTALTSEVVYNGMNFPYKQLTPEEAQSVLGRAGFPVSANGMLLHVGGGQWYKNQVGVIELYSQYAAREIDPLPLWCVSPEPTAAVKSALARVPPKGRVLYFQNLDNHSLQAAYSLARAFIFPSLAEGFGWPLVEAQACGCPVITTDEAPMNEVAGDSASFLPPMTPDVDIEAWATKGAAVLRQLLSRGTAERMQYAARGRAWAARFDSGSAIAGYLAIYEKILGGTFGRASEPRLVHETKG